MEKNESEDKRRESITCSPPNGHILWTSGLDLKRGPTWMLIIIWGALSFVEILLWEDVKTSPMMWPYIVFNPTFCNMK